MLEIMKECCIEPQESINREWLVSNGIGGFASGTVSGVLSRSYHALLVAALNPPLGRTSLVSKLDETVCINGQSYELFSNQWKNIPQSIAPHGYSYLERFYLDGTSPVWEYRLGEVILEKCLWMEWGENTSFVQYRLLEGASEANLSIKFLVNYKDFHANIHANDWQMQISPVENGLRVLALEGATAFYLYHNQGKIHAQHSWYRDYFFQVDNYRGLNDGGDHLHAATLEANLQADNPLVLTFSTEANLSLDAEASYLRKTKSESHLIELAQVQDTPQWIQQLVLAADQFIVKRTSQITEDGRSIIAGYHWFGDWGRDTMISLAGLTLSTHRFKEAAAILRTFAAYVDMGMLPNRFPDKGEHPEYNTVDASLWYFQAIRQYHEASKDHKLLEELYPILKDIIEWHQRGTRYNIHECPNDYLLYSGKEGIQLTWMDAKVGDWVVTPRTGKAIEINALWYNALRTMGDFAQELSLLEDKAHFNEKANRVEQSFSRFWNAECSYCFDVVETPTGNDPSLRPNQIFAVSLPYSPLSKEQQKAVVDACMQYLLTPRGLRSLAPFEKDYVGVYGGDNVKRDASYHQGTVWAWLIGAFVEAHYRVYGDKAAAYRFLEPFQDHLKEQGIGSIAEIFDGDAPHTARGCIAQAWSVAEILRVWCVLSRQD